jgi:WD40 repeat protein
MPTIALSKLAVGILATACLAVAHAADPAPKKEPPREPPLVRTLSFSPDGTLLAVAAMPRDRGGMVFVWDVSTRKLVSKYDRAGESPNAAFAPDSKSIVIANGRKLLPVLDPQTGQKIGDLGPLPAEITAVAAAGLGKWVMLGKDNIFRVWDEKGKKVAADLGGGKRVWSWSVAPSGKWLFVSFSDSGDRLWDLSTGEEVQGMAKSQPGRVNVAAFIAEDRLLLGSNMGSHRLIELPSGKELLRFKNEGGTGAMAYSPKLGMLACRYYTSSTVGLTPFSLQPPADAEKTRTAALLKDCDSDDYSTREKAAAALVELGPAIEPLLKSAMTDGPSAEVRMRARVARETILNKPRHSLKGHLDEIRPMAFSPDGKLFATGGADGLVFLWDPATAKELARLDSASN